MTERFQEKKAIDLETGIMMIVVATLALFSQMRDKAPTRAVESPQVSRIISPIDIFENIETSPTPTPTPTDTN